MQFAAGVVTGNTILVRPSADGRIEVVTNSPSIDVVIDVQGWWGAASESWLYDYDPDGLRISKTAPDGVVTVYDWDKSASVPKLVAETAGTAVTRYVYGPGGVPVEQVNPDGSVTFLHADALGSIRVLTNSGGAKTGSVTYKPFGGLAASTGTLSRLGYAGEYTDAETGFVYLRARFYDPATGQFLSQDPLVALTGQPYQYAANNPVNLTDPLGLCPACGTGGGSGGNSWWETAWEHRGTIASVTAMGVCLIPYFGWASCAVASGTALLVRVQQRGTDEMGWNIADAIMTTTTLGLGGAFTAAGQSATAARSTQNMWWNADFTWATGGLSWVTQFIPGGYDAAFAFGESKATTGDC